MQHAMQQRMEAAGFDDQTIADSLEAEGDDLKEKRLAYIAIIKQELAMADARYKAADSMVMLADASKSRADRLEAALFASMQATGDKDLIGIEFEAHIKGKTAAVDIIDINKVPALYMRTPDPVPPKAVPDKLAIKKALLAGELVDGCTLGIDKKLVIS